MKIDPGYPCLSSDCSSGYDAVLAVVILYAQAGLLTPGSSYLLRLPSFAASGLRQLLSPVTAAGPFPIHTEFPLRVL